MKKRIRKLVKQLILFCIGGAIYTLLEKVTRGYTHWTMFIVGGLCFFLIGAINEIIPWTMPIWKQCTIGALIVTIIEFISGCIINLWMKWDIWDYSDMPLNVMGQICLPFTILWIFLSLLAIVIDDFIRWKFFGEEKPQYNWGWK